MKIPFFRHRGTVMKDHTYSASLFLDMKKRPTRWDRVKSAINAVVASITITIRGKK